MKDKIYKWISLANEPMLQHLDNSDYEENGLRHCERCRTPKQMYLDIEDEQIIVGIPCECRKRAIDRDNRIQEMKREAERRQAVREKGLKYPEILSATFKNDHNPDSVESKALKRYVDKWEEVKKENLGILLYGSVGTGKSYYAGAIANEVINKGDRALVMTVAEVTALRSPEEQRIIEQRINDWELFVLDDLGAERLTEFSMERVFDTVDRRYSSGKPMIVTTNLSKAEMENCPPEQGAKKRIYDRVLAMCSIGLKMSGRSKRKDLANQKKDLAKEILSGEREKE